jgi:DNA invertase Pin-like site-specific DNA recombinase
VQEFRDEGVSGALCLADRPGFTAILESAMIGGNDWVMVKKADRLARNLVGSELLLRTCRDQVSRVIGLIAAET